MSKEAQLKKNLDFILKDFATDPDPKEIFNQSENNPNVQILQQFEIQHTVLDVRFNPYIVFIIFVYLKEFPFRGKWEKVAWEIPVFYKGIPFILTHQKFGFRILSNTESDEVISVATDAMQQINKAIPLAEALINPVIINAVQNRKVTLPNQSKSLESRYKYFRKQADKRYKTIHQYIPMSINQNSPVDILPHKVYQAIEIAKYYVSSMLDAYFSMLENFLVLALPFVKAVDLTSKNIEDIIRANWKDKFKMLFDFKNDIPAMKMYEKLIKLKEDLRNPFSHGYFLSGGQSIFVHMTHLGAIPMTLTQTRNKLAYRIDSISPPHYDNIKNVFDDSIKFLSKHPNTKYAYLYVKSGLSIAYDTNSVNSYRSAAKTIRQFKEFIGYMAWQHDNAANMDW